MKKNDIVSLRIEDMGINGEGIGKVAGFPLFVKDAIIGDEIKAKITKINKDFGFARVEEVITPSRFRVEPRCPIARPCGGCQLQEMEYLKQLEFKENKVFQHLRRIGGFSEELLAQVTWPIIGMDNPFNYRNKAAFPFGVDKEGEIITGFYAYRSHNIIPTTDCAVGVPINQEILETIIPYMKRNRITAYDEKNHTGTLRHVVIRHGFKTREIMVCLVINSKKSNDLRNVEELITILRKISKMTGIVVNFNTQRTNVILGERYEVLWGKGYITDYLTYGKDIEKELNQDVIETEEIIDVRNTEEGTTGKKLNQEVIKSDKNSYIEGSDKGEIEKGFDIKGLEKETIENIIKQDVKENGIQKEIKYRISSLSFYQINPIQTEKLYALVLEYGDLKGWELVWDLYCGIGTISLFLSQKARKVIGVDIVTEAIKDAKENARINGIRNVEFIAGKSEEVTTRYYEDKPEELLTCYYEDKLAPPDVVVLDPPRKGCDEALLGAIAKVKPEKVIVVSCDSATLARDLKYLCENGYELRKVRAVDLFPMTVHVEVVCLLVREH